MPFARHTDVSCSRAAANGQSVPVEFRNTVACGPDGLRVKLKEPTATTEFGRDDQNDLGATGGANDTQVLCINEPQRSTRERAAREHEPLLQFDALGSPNG